MQASDSLAIALKKKAANGDSGNAGEAGGAAAVVSDLTRLFHVGQYVRCVVVGLPGDPIPSMAPAGRPASASATAAKSLQLSLRLRRLCAGLGATTLHEGAVVPACVRSAEDHGYTLDLGIKVGCHVSSSALYENRSYYKVCACSQAAPCSPRATTTAMPVMSCSPCPPPSSQGISAFLKRRDHEAAFGEGSALLPGMMLEVAVTTPGGAAAGARTVNVTTNPTAVGLA